MSVLLSVRAGRELAARWCNRATHSVEPLYRTALHCTAAAAAAAGAEFASQLMMMMRTHLIRLQSHTHTHSFVVVCGMPPIRSAPVRTFAD